MLLIVYNRGQYGDSSIPTMCNERVSEQIHVECGHLAGPDLDFGHVRKDRLKWWCTHNVDAIFWFIRSAYQIQVVETIRITTPTASARYREGENASAPKIYSG